jgi:hypothetical protein
MQAALLGYEQQLACVTQRIAEIRRELAGGGSPSTEAGAKTKWKMSAGGRKRIADATRKRWAAYRAAKAAAEK